MKSPISFVSFLLKKDLKPFLSSHSSNSITNSDNAKNVVFQSYRDIQRKHSLPIYSGILKSKPFQCGDNEKIFPFDKSINIQSFIESQSNNLMKLDLPWERLESKNDENWIDFNEVQLMAPIPLPKRNIFCVGKNYLDHIQEVTKKDNKVYDIPKHPMFFTKAPDCVIGPDDLIESHSSITKYLDYEVELAVIIGKEGMFY